jgi:DNA-binding transcriptional ArsR family regulator
MVRDSPIAREDPDLDSVLGALYDEDCRTIVEELDEPRTASELVDRCNIPRSTLYRKLDLLTEATLLEEGTEIRKDGSHASRYEIDFKTVVITCSDDQDLEVGIERPPRRADDRLAELWSEVRKEV